MAMNPMTTAKPTDAAPRETAALLLACPMAFHLCITVSARRAIAG
jgi:hypothetical protein